MLIMEVFITKTNSGFYFLILFCQMTLPFIGHCSSNLKVTQKLGHIHGWFLWKLRALHKFTNFSLSVVDIMNYNTLKLTRNCILIVCFNFWKFHEWKWKLEIENRNVRKLSFFFNRVALNVREIARSISFAFSKKLL